MNGRIFDRPTSKDIRVLFLEDIMTDADLIGHGVDRTNMPYGRTASEALRHSEEQLKEANKQLRVLSTRLENIREEERTNMARKVHDELGQALTALKMNVAWLDAKIPRSQKKAVQKIRSMDETIDTTIQTVQRIATELRPAILDDGGFVAAAEWQAREFKQISGIACRFITEAEDITLDDRCSTALFRILQETLTNVARHAGATNVEIRLREEFNEVVMTVKDDGEGITSAQIDRSQSLGILGMKERALLVGGKVVITGKQDKGTTVTVRVPNRGGRSEKFFPED